MKKLYIASRRKLIQNQKELEDKLNVKISVKGTSVAIEGNDELSKYFATRVIEALDYRFLVDDAMLLKDEEFDFRVVKIKDHTNRRDMNVIKGRIIGTKGKTLNALNELTGCEFAVKGNEVAIIGPVERIHEAEQAVISLVKGSKQGNVYAHLEGLNRNRRKREASF